MKGIGNYRQLGAPKPTTFDRRLAQIVAFLGPRASVRFMDGVTYTIPSDPLRKLGLKDEDTFFLITEYRGRDVVSVRVERQGQARGAATKRAQPKVMLRDGLKLTTRR